MAVLLSQDDKNTNNTLPSTPPSVLVDCIPTPPWVLMVCFPPIKWSKKWSKKIVQKMVQKIVQKIVQKWSKKWSKKWSRIVKWSGNSTWLCTLMQVKKLANNYESNCLSTHIKWVVVEWFVIYTYLHVFINYTFFFKDNIILHPNSIIFVLKNLSSQRKRTSHH